MKASVKVVTKKKEKASPPKVSVSKGAAQDEPSPEETEQEESDEQSEEDLAAEAAPVKAVKLVKRGDKDYAAITMLRTIVSPTIGKTVLAEVVGSRQMVKGQTYRVPPNAAMHLRDKKAAIASGE